MAGVVVDCASVSARRFLSGEKVCEGLTAANGLDAVALLREEVGAVCVQAGVEEDEVVEAEAELEAQPVAVVAFFHVVVL